MSSEKTSVGLRRRLADRLEAPVLKTWRLGFRLWGVLSPSRLSQWSSSGDQRVLVVATHPDDELLGCGGAILCHLKAGDQVEVVYVTQGERSGALDLGSVEMAAVRRAEAAAARVELGVERTQWLAVNEGMLGQAELAATLRALLLDISPDVIYAPSIVDYLPDHRCTAAALADALMGLHPAPSQVRICQIQVPLTPELTNLMLEVPGAQRLQFVRALSAYPSQRWSFAPNSRMRGYDRLAHNGSGPIEVYWEVVPPTYIRIHREASQAFPTWRMRGLRFWGWTDPLAYISGYRARRILAAAARE